MTELSMPVLSLVLVAVQPRNVPPDSVRPHVVAGKREQLVVRVQERCGIGKDEAQQYVGLLAASFKDEDLGSEGWRWAIGLTAPQGARCYPRTPFNVDKWADANVRGRRAVADR